MEKLYREGENLSMEEKLALIRAFCNSVLHNEVRSLKIESEVGPYGLTGVQTVTMVLRPEISDWLEEANRRMEEKIETSVRRQP